MKYQVITTIALTDIVEAESEEEAREKCQEVDTWHLINNGYWTVETKPAKLDAVLTYCEN